MKSLIRGCIRLCLPMRSLAARNVFKLPGAYLRYLDQWRRFRAMGGRADFEQLQPFLFDNDPASQSGGGDYFYQDIWALNRLAELRPGEHHDVGSRVDGFVGQATCICPIIFWDVRPPRVRLPRFEYRFGDLMNLPIADRTLSSLSCLHTAEHVGLGRYGDTLDPNGTHKALRELARVLASEGQLLFSMPVGRDRVCFNAHRVWHPERPLEVLHDLRLQEFAAVLGNGEFVADIKPANLSNEKYSCGLYRFRRQ